MHLKNSAIIKPIVQQFVADLNGRYRSDCSDRLLVAMLMRQLDRTPGTGRAAPESYAEAVLAGDSTAAYAVGCDVFEVTLERGANAGGNGHHVAQAFADTLMTSLPPKQKFHKGQQLIHVATGNAYSVIGTPDDGYVLEANNQPAYVYSPVDQINPARPLRRWLRAASEMEDGRFIPRLLEDA